MNAITVHIQYISFGALLLFGAVIMVAICLNYHVKTGVQVGWFRFFLETDRDERRSAAETQGKECQIQK